MLTKFIKKKIFSFTFFSKSNTEINTNCNTIYNKTSLRLNTWAVVTRRDPNQYSTYLIDIKYILHCHSNDLGVRLSTDANSYLFEIKHAS